MRTNVRLLAEAKRRDELVAERFRLESDVEAADGEPSDTLAELVDDFDDAYQELEDEDRDGYVFCEGTQDAMRWVDPLAYGVLRDGPVELTEGVYRALLDAVGLKEGEVN